MILNLIKDYKFFILIFKNKLYKTKDYFHSLDKMSLKYFSIPEIDFSKSWKTGFNKIKCLNKFDKWMTIFWLIGPFIFLIERDPADLWLSLICIIFIIRCTQQKDWEWVTQLWFRSALALWIFGLFTALISSDPFLVFNKALSDRFPPYASSSSLAWQGQRYKNCYASFNVSRYVNNVCHFICRNFVRKQD